MKKNNTSLTVSLLILLITILTSIGINDFFYIYLFVIGIVIGYYILKETKYLKLSILILTAFFWSTGLIIFLSSLIALLSIPLHVYIIWIPTLLVIILSFLKPIKLNKSILKFNKWDVLLFIFATLSIFSHLISIKDFIAPMLHDPIAHATWVKEILDTGFINYFYSPGLHILSSIGVMADNNYISQYMLIITNLFNALSFVPVYLFIKDYFKSNRFAIFSSLLFLIGFLPSNFFVIAGKNALVLAIPFMFLLLFFSSLKIDKIKKIIILNIITFILISIHYPVAAITLIGAFFILINKEKIKGLYNILIGCGLGIIWGLVKMKYEVVRLEESVYTSSDGIELTINNVISFLKGIYSQIQPYFDSNWGQYILFLGVLGLVIMTLIALKKRKYLCFMLFFYSNILMMILTEFVDKLGFLHIVYLTQILTLFVFIYIGAAFVITEIIFKYLFNISKYFKQVFYIAVLLYAIWGSYNIFTVYKTEQEAKNVVTYQDVSAFEWINENLEEDVVILNNAIIGHRKNVVYASDAGAWIPVFTDNITAMPFSEFSSKNTHENYEVFTKILNKNYTCEDINYLINKSIRYYYQGSKGVYGGQINPTEEDNRNFVLIHNSESARLFEMIPCD